MSDSGISGWNHAEKFVPPPYDKGDTTCNVNHHILAAPNNQAEQKKRALCDQEEVMITF